LNAQISE